MTTKMTLGYYEGDTFYVLLTNPNALEANVKVYLKEDPQAQTGLKLRPRGFQVIELSQLEPFKGKRGTVMVEADVGIIVDWGERLCKSCKRATLELLPKRIDEANKFTIIYEWVCKKCSFKEVEGRLEAVKKDDGVEVVFKPSQ